MLQRVTHILRRLLQNWNVTATRSQRIARTIFADLDYDFSNFAVESFIGWIEQNRSTKLDLIARRMPRDIFGAWVRVEGNHRDIILYEVNAPELHQLLTVFHESSHLLLGHQTLTVTAQEADQILESDTLPAFLRQKFVKYRSFHRSERDEDDAEALAMLMLENLLRHTQLTQTLSMPPANTNLAAYFKGMELVQVEE